MDVDLTGRVQNTKLPLYRPLLPLYEAVVNSIDAVRDRNESPSSGSIRVIVDREPAQDRVDGQPDLGAIRGFEIRDTGVGFTESNYRSFATSDSTFKAGRGGKGVGRLLWLKAFSRVEVESAFVEEGARRHRRFEFSLPSGICRHSVEADSGGPFETVVRLAGLESTYADRISKRSDLVAVRLLAHCMGLFLTGGCPRIVVEDAGEAVVLNDLAKDALETATRLGFELKGRAFELTVLKLRVGSEQHHQLRYCAHGREVLAENLSTSIVSGQAEVRISDQ